MESSSISPSQLIYLTTGFLLGSSMILFPGGTAQNNAWLAVIAGLAEGLIFLAIYNALAMRLPGKTMVEINDMILGPYLGKAFSLAYLLFFFYVGSEVLRTFAEFFKFIMSATPLPVLMIAMLLVSASAVRNGIEVIARCSQILVPIAIAVFGLNFMLLLKDFNPGNLLPFMDIPVKKFILASHSTAALPFGEAVVFLMILAFVNKPSRAGQAMAKAFLLTAIVLCLSALRTISVLGPLASLTTFPAYSTIRLISIADILTRMEIIPAFTFLFLGFLKFTVFYYATALGASQMLKMNTYRPLVLPLGALICVTSLLLYDPYIFDILDATMLFPFYSMFFVLILPLITLVVAKIRNQDYTQEVTDAG